MCPDGIAGSASSSTEAGTGRLEVIYGPMFSGKSRELIRRLQDAVASGARVAAYKSDLDVRHDEGHIASHDGFRFPCTPIHRAGAMVTHSGTAGVIGVDEAQFFDGDIVQVCAALTDAGKRVVVAGLHEDYQGRPFAPLTELAARAEESTFLLATCAVCGEAARHTQRLVQALERVVVGGSDAYEPRCSRCFRAVVSA